MGLWLMQHTHPRLKSRQWQPRHARTMRPSTALPPAYLYVASQRILGVVPPPLARRPGTHNATTSAILTPSRRPNYVPASPGDCRQMEHTCMPIAPSGTGTLLLTDIGCGTLPLAPRLAAPDHTRQHPLLACDSNLDSGNHDMSRLSTSVCLPFRQLE
jgi:hypothetical protein